MVFSIKYCQQSSQSCLFVFVKCIISHLHYPVDGNHRKDKTYFSDTIYHLIIAYFLFGICCNIFATSLSWALGPDIEKSLFCLYVFTQGNWILYRLKSMFSLYRNNYFDLHSRSIDWVLYDGKAGCKSVN